MKKYTLKSLYAEAEKILIENGIEITEKSKLDVSAEICKNHKDLKPISQFIIQFCKDTDSPDSIFAYAESVENCLARFISKVCPVNSVDDITL